MSKLAIHAHRPDKWVVDIAPQVNSKWVKQLFLSDLVDYWPLMWTVARPILPGVDAQESTYWRQGAHGADAYIEAVDNAYAPNRLDTLYGSGGHRVGYFELICEPIYGSYAELQRLVDFECAVTERYNAHGRRVLLGSFARGWPNVNDKTTIQILAPLWEMASRKLNGLAVHMYGWPRLRDNPRWGALWHRRLIEALRAEHQPMPPIWITEYGAHEWRKCYANWEDYKADLLWADGELQQDKEVVAAFVYTSGCPQEDMPKWGDFEINAEQWREVVAWTA